MMRRASYHVTAIAVLVCFASFAAAEDIATFSDVQLIEETREAVGAQDAEAALDLLTEMQRRGTGIFAGAERSSCGEVIDLPEGITDWRFKGAARQAYITAAKTKALEAGTCACLFDGFSFDMFTSEVLGKSSVDLVNDDRAELEAYLKQHQRETEARYRDLETVCRSM
ncbi:MAG: hypothetical protein A3D16_19965 [Rhodobacterales bacterium RIFCSPHIGHO2_02_FULL_62_130]|nr:MAG: hypothetical protein A3E48_02315 [Rhodobacterales bacterium RIFCSPHIGHO2_12_FULL_62_75]OHC59537.1 MAG: hypothetical protein A3D16_19965 [Rhodobacterales bacterium RIFCSPHIGHO2_02_FULL_62_130]